MTRMIAPFRSPAAAAFLCVFLQVMLLPCTASAASGTSEIAAEMPKEVDIIRPAGDDELHTFLWKNRLVIVFADTPDDPQFKEQLELLRDDLISLAERDVLVLTDTDPAAKTPLRRKMRPRGFMLVLVDKDGGIKLRKPFPRPVRELTSSIDQTTIRQHEVEERRNP